ncbi:MAG: tape measure protein [Lachnospiraceae bacterium]|nr:tape measure protein [Lachnospiraceae bacterium]
MGRDVSIAISARDNYSSAIRTMSNTSRAFSKDSEDLQVKLNSLDRTKATMKFDVDRAKRAMQEAQKEYNNLARSSETSAEQQQRAAERVVEASEAYDRARRNMGLVSTEIRNTERDLRSLDSTLSRTQNRASTSGGGIAGTSGVMGALAAAGIGKMVNDMVGTATTTFIGSAFGSDASSMIEGVISGAISGAVAGSVIPGIGTAVGTAVGAASGVVSGIAQVYSKKDEAYKSTVQENYETVTQAQADSLTNGSSIAGERETSRISFSTLLGGQDIADKFLNDVIDFSNSTPFQYDDLTSMAKVLTTYKYKVDELMPTMKNIGDAGAALGMSTGDMNTVATGLGRMRSSGKGSLEYINLLQERGIDAIGYLAEAKGIDNAEVYERISKGLIDGAEAAQIISDAMSRDYSGSMKAISETFEGLSSTVLGLNNELDNAMGAGYNAERKEGMQNEINYLSGGNGERVQDANGAIGEYEASLENTKEALQRQRQAQAMVSNDYKKAEAVGDGVTMGRLLAEAQVKAQNDYNASTGAQEMLASEESLIEGIQENTALDAKYYEAGYLKGQWFSKGRVAATSDASLILGSEERNSNQYNDEGSIWGFGDTDTNKKNDDSAKKAFGMSYVPKDNVEYTLHEGERILTASENRAYSSGQGRGNVVVSGNNFVVREEADIDKIASEIVRQMEIANNTVGG